MSKGKSRQIAVIAAIGSHQLKRPENNLSVVFKSSRDTLGSCAALATRNLS